MTTRERATGEKGLAVILTGLLLIPLMTFAAFGVDLASWYSRISYLQKSADAASLAGTVWMPSLGKATIEATASLRRNGIVNGQDGMVVVVEQGTTLTSLRVTVTDTDPDRIFSQVFSDQQSLTRFAEAEYNLPIPLGSPLNYFGGDRSKTIPDAPPTTFDVSWPLDYTTRVPANRSPDGCNIGTSSGQNLGRWPNSGGYTTGYDGADPQCAWTVTGAPASGTTAVPPPDYSTRTPTNPTCRAYDDGNTANAIFGRWNAGSPPTWSTSTSGTSGMCTWSNFTTTASSIPSFATTQTPTNRPCRVGYETSGAGGGHWPSSGGFSTTTPNSVVGELHATGNQLCRWRSAFFDSTPPTPPNPIAIDRNPGFWAAIGGPGDVAAFGDAFSARCTGSTNCGGTPNLMHKDEGYWYVIKMPASGATATSVRIFDAAYNSDATSTTYTGDTRGTFTSGNGFTTTFRVYRQPNPLDFGSRVALGPNTPTTSGPSCHWGLRDQTAFRLNWTELCSITPANGETYLLNVLTSGTSGDTDGVNGYAAEAISAGAVQPAVYAYGSMAMRNNIAAGEAKFYLAEVGPQYAGRTLVISLFDSGDASGNAFLRPAMPGTAPTDFSDIPSSLCGYSSSPAPNPGIFSGSPDGQQTSPPVGPTTPGLSNCRIQTTSSGTQQFNDEWLEIRVDIPTGYSCTLGVNPELATGSCWWGIKYNFSSTSNDVTTWQARIEGSPVHLTQ